MARRVRSDQRVCDDVVAIEEVLPDPGVPAASGRLARGADQGIGHLAHRGRHDDHLVALVGGIDGKLRRLSDAFGGPDGGPAEFHYDEHEQ